eukprot:TRINITY_DN6709_c1_g2_i2.p1 TRINITY_DN6709_c1_g2~~TRINITY_DN6709_c1_g2_i2.p1  ORF type:complete len:409 (-),score=93.90 TRINITY_DN6709_c1_g2_i2:311-1537(-)
MANDGGTGAMQAPRNWARILGTPGMLSFGTATVVTQKLLFGMRGDSKHGRHKFDKPWWQTNMMFLGMALCLLVFEVKKLVTRRRRRVSPNSKGVALEDVDTIERSASVQQEQPSSPSDLKAYFYVMAPAIADLIATAMMNVGLLWTPASVWQMLRGSQVVFTAFLSVVFLKRHIHRHHWVGIVVVCCALSLVAYSSLRQPTPKEQDKVDTRYELWGIILVVWAQLVQAAQTVIEEFLLKDVQIDAVFIVGLEGLWGLLACSFICLPICQQINVKGFHEDTHDTLDMLGRNGEIVGVIIFYMLVILVYNIAGMWITQQFSAVYRTILEGARTACIWGTNLFIFYAIDKSYGEQWTWWSVMELAGFFLMIAGTVIYNEFVKLPWDFFEYGEEEKDRVYETLVDSMAEEEQ